MHVEVSQDEGECDSHVLATFPKNYGECQRRGLGTSTPCWVARCKYSLLVDLAPRTSGRPKVRELIDLGDESGELFERETCALAVAAKGQVEPVRIAEILRCSLGLEELLQRLALAKVGPALVRVRDLGRGVEVDVDVVKDGRR